MNERIIGWMAYFADYSGMAVFGAEIDALRYAVENGMKVCPVKDGEEFGP